MNPPSWQHTSTSTTSSIATTNPATGEREVGYEPHSSAEIDAAIRDADAVFARWRTRPVAERAKVVGRAAELMLERKDELAALITLEMGKLAKEAQGEVELAASILQWYADRGEGLLADRPLEVEEGSARIRHEPIGVLLGVMPWNFPYYQVARFAGPNLVAGNVIVLKHASICPQSALAIERLFADAGAPAHVYTNLFVPGKEVSAIIEDPRIKGVSLTGSEGAGAAVAETAGRELKKSVLELGGSDPCIILEDADMEAAVKGALVGRMANMGQSCTAAKRLIVVGPQARHDAFVSGLVDAMGALEAGDPADEATTLGPLSSEDALKTLVEQVEETVEQGATVRLGGGAMERAGWYMQPTVLTDVTKDMRAYSDELFGPVAVVYSVPDEDAAIELANDSSFGLGGAIYSADVAHAEELAARIETGMVWINHPTASEPGLPFGGIKRSGYGRELSDLGIHEFVNHKLIRSLEPGKAPEGSEG